MENQSEHPSPHAPDPATAPPEPRDVPGRGRDGDPDASSSPAPHAAEVAAPPVADPAEEPIAPGVPRLGTPAGAARSIREPGGLHGHHAHPSYAFLAIVSIITLVSDVSSKLWAEKRLEQYPPFITVWENHLSFILAKNRGGAWGLLQGTNENVRRPFFLLVSAAAIAFIVTLYRRLQPRQRALKWGLPLVLGGALGNVFDRIRYGHVIDFIDYRADWVRKMNEVVARAFHGQGTPTDHWPTFNVADIAICVGVALMAIDMFTAKRGRIHPITGRTLPPSMPPPPPPAIEEPPALEEPKPAIPEAETKPVE
jgi:signal peptidase II